MSKEKLKIETALLVEGDCPHCAERLQTLLLRHKGIEQAHIHGDPAVLCLHFDPNLVTLAAVDRMARDTGSELSHRYRHARFRLATLASADAAGPLARALEAVEGVLHANVNIAAASISLAFDSEKTSQAALKEVVSEMGFALLEEHGCAPSVSCCGGHAHTHAHAAGHHHHGHESHDHHHHVGCAHGKVPSFLPAWLREHWTMVLVVLAGLFFGLGWLGEHFWGWSPQVARGFYVLAYLAGGYDISTHALPGLLRGRFDTDVLMLAAALGAAAIGQWSEGAFLLFLFALGHAGEHYALDRARRAVDELGRLMPKTAWVRRDTELVETPIEAVEIGAVVVVRAGDRIPVDGTVLQGRSAVDQGPITGESQPVLKEPGDKVFAATVNAENALEVEVTKLAQDNTLQRVMQMVAEAQAQRGPTQRFTQKFTRWFVPAVLLATVAMMVLPPALGLLPAKDAFYRAMLLLVASSPCALALGTPAAVLAGIAQAARNGVLIKGGVHLENLGSVKVVALDKTGTLTEGRFRLTDLEPGADASSQQLLAAAAALEEQSNHPLSQAVVEHARAQDLSWSHALAIENIAGRGLKGEVDGRQMAIGSHRFVGEAAVIPEQVSARVEALEGEGKTVILMACEGVYMGLLALADEPRAEARETLSALRTQGVEILVMLTGDNDSAAQRVGQLVGLTEVRAGLLPADKLEAVRGLQEKHGLLAMVGDGINDAPALALADVGVAMGGAGTAVALETADVALMSDDLSKLPYAVALSRASRAVIKQNLCISLGVIAILIGTSVTGLLPLGPTVVAHEGSTLLVVLNALRLLRFRL